MRTLTYPHRVVDSTKGDTVLPMHQKEAYEAFFEATEENGILDPKTTVMIQLAASFAIGCYP